MLGGLVTTVSLDSNNLPVPKVIIAPPKGCGDISGITVIGCATPAALTALNNGFPPKATFQLVFDVESLTSNFHSFPLRSPA